VKPDITVDTLYDGAIAIAQSRRGHRFSVDAVALAEWVAPASGARVLDLGAGAGVIALILAHRFPTVSLTAIELQSELAELARDNVVRNRVDHRVSVLQADLRDYRGVIEAGQYDVVVSNPPYHPAAAGRINPDASRAAARHELNGGLEDFLEAARYALGERGQLFLVYPAWRLPHLLATLSALRMSPARLAFVHADRDAEASLVLVEARVGGAPDLRIEAPITLGAVE